MLRLVMATKRQTRADLHCPVFGSPSEFPQNQLPTHKDVMKCYFFERITCKEKNFNRDPPVTEIVKQVANKLVAIYNRASIPILSMERIKFMITSFKDKHKNLMKCYKQQKESESYKCKLISFSENAQKLFDIASCKCQKREHCSCIATKKIPLKEFEFLQDQRNERNLFIAGVDAATSKFQMKRLPRQLPTPNSKQSGTTDDQITLSQLSSITSGASSTSDDDYFPNNRSLKSIGEHSNSKGSIKLSSFAESCDRTGVSDRVAALLSSSILQDLGMITEENDASVIDRSKVRRDRKRKREELQNNISTLTNLYFDGRKDSTLTMIRKGDRYHRKTSLEEHITVITEPDSSYIFHFTPPTGSARSIVSKLFERAEENNIDLTNIAAIGCDGTAVNTGHKGGALKLIEERLDKPVHWFICLLHGNELPLRHLFEKLDGKTSGPNSFTGPIGKQLKYCETLTVKEFTLIKVDLPDMDFCDLSTDQKYLYEMHQSISSGSVSEALASRQPGNISHARWVTTANRILRLYVGTDNPTDKLRTLVEFIMKVYTPMWFAIKRESHVRNGAKHIHKMLVSLMNFHEDVVNIVKPVIQRNSYFASTENILLAMIQDERDFVRELGWRRILKARERKTAGIREYEIPPIQLSDNYINMINWQTATINEPPLTRHLTTSHIENNIKAKEYFVMDNLPCHSQGVERAIKIVTEASSLVCDYNSRHGLIRSRLQSRNKIPKFETKSDFKL